MAIRLRIVDGHWIAVCAAKTGVRLGDIYLDDGMHEALATKFAIDFEQPEIANPIKTKLMKEEESGQI